MPVCFCPLQRLRAMRLLSISSNSDVFSLRVFASQESQITTTHGADICPPQQLLANTTENVFLQPSYNLKAVSNALPLYIAHAKDTIGL